MPRSYRGVILALGLIVFIGLSYAGYYQLQRSDEPSYTDYKYQPARDRLAPPFGKDAKITTRAYQPYCDNPKERDDADLCAQWAAVQAVGESNRLARLSILITGLEFGALIVSLIFTGWAAIAAAKAARIAEEATKDADRALEIAQRNAEAAARQVEVAQETAKRQLRAYVSVTAINETAPPTPGAKFTARVKFVNRGNTPAHNVTIKGWMVLREPTFIPERVETELPDNVSTSQGPNVELVGTIQMAEPLDEAACSGLSDGTLAIFCFGTVDYVDAFGEPRRTHFRQVRRQTDDFSYCQAGNYAD